MCYKLAAMRLELCLALAALTACSSHDKPKDPDRRAAIKLDAGVAPAPKGPVGVGVDPSRMHLDDDSPTRPVVTPPGNHQARDIEITLRSSPPGARVSVDGTALGNTPAFCNCKADGREHEFLFTLPGHAIARYRFVPITSGVLHARLDRIADDVDAGVPPPEVMAPQPPPPNNPPAPLVQVDAAVAPPPAVTFDAGAAPLPPTNGPQP
jgi:hypothetical protein